MGCLSSKAVRSCAAADGELPRKEPLSSEPSPKPPSPFVGVLLEGIATECHSIATLGVREEEKRAEKMFQDLGLGRGIDATTVQPWLNRTSLQVRPVRFKDLIGTEEGGYLESYKETSFSSHTLQLEMKGEVNVPADGSVSPKVKIGVGSDCVRTTSTELCVFGRRVVNRTISFQEQFQDIPFSPGFLNANSSQPGAASGNREEASFEENLCKWILERYQCPNCSKGKQSLCNSEQLIGGRTQPSVDRFEKLWDPKEKLEASPKPADVEKEIKERCLQFVKHFHVTHYVSAIRLGAAEYATMTEREFMQEVKLSGNLGLDKFVNSRFMASNSSQRCNRKCEYRAIGTIMREGKSAYVPRAIEKEAVIEVEFMPIYQLVRHASLGNFLKAEVQKYIREQTDPRSELSIVVMHSPLV